MSEAYPLSWPEGWQRTPAHKRTAGGRFNTTFDRARSELLNELRLLGAKGIVVSSWLPLRRDGQPYADQARRRLDDPGVAVYFTLRGRQMVMARDAYVSVHDNLRSVGLGIAHLRGMERHGGGQMMERAFEGFAALPPPKRWHEILSVSAHASREEINAAFRKLAGDHHPDREGGSHERMAELSRARDEALKGTNP